MIATDYTSAVPKITLNMFSKTNGEKAVIDRPVNAANSTVPKHEPKELTNHVNKYCIPHRTNGLQVKIQYPATCVRKAQQEHPLAEAT